MNSFNTYNEKVRAEAYAKLEFPGTYYLAYRDIPEIVKKHSSGKNALDFGCGAGRSSRFISNLGFNVTGLDISHEMIQIAKNIPSSCKFMRMENGDFSLLKNRKFDLITSIFTFDNIPGKYNRMNILKGLRKHLSDTGIFISLVSSSELYSNEWLSFTTKDFPENKHASSGDVVKIINLETEDLRPVDDIYTPHVSHVELFEESGFSVVETYKPIGKKDEPFEWKNEAALAPWTIFVLRKSK